MVRAGHDRFHDGAEVAAPKGRRGQADEPPPGMPGHRAAVQSQPAAVQRAHADGMDGDQTSRPARPLQEALIRGRPRQVQGQLRRGFRDEALPGLRRVPAAADHVF